MEPVYDIAVIGGGIIGCGVARDAAGRGCRVCLLEQGDLASGTSWTTTKLIHGGLRYLEQGDFRLVREALREREILMGLAPHLVRPARFVLPLRRGTGRPELLLRLGLFLYDRLGGRERLPASARLDLSADPAGGVLQKDVSAAFSYADCRVDDARLVIANASDAAARGAVVRVGTKVEKARRVDGVWELTVHERGCDRTSVLRARILVNAAGPWVERVAVERGGSGAAVRPRPGPPKVRLVQGSHIVVPRLFDHDACYTLQNDDRRVVFVLPYLDDRTLIGATDVELSGDPAAARASDGEVAYLCAAVNRWLTTKITPADVVWRFTGVRPLYDDGAKAAQTVSRDHILELDATGGAAGGAAPLLTIYGGKLTAYRRVAEAVMGKLRPYLPTAAAGRGEWTATAPLPGGDFPPEGSPALIADLRRAHPYLTAAHAARLVGAYGTAAARLLDGARRIEDLGRDFGATLYEVEVRHMMQAEWARAVEDVLWRRSKLGLRLSLNQAAAVEAFMRD
jgi:glycerol-3-phosphate dehydrogenase